MVDIAENQKRYAQPSQKSLFLWHPLFGVPETPNDKLNPAKKYYGEEPLGPHDASDTWALVNNTGKVQLLSINVWHSWNKRPVGTSEQASLSKPEYVTRS